MNLSFHCARVNASRPGRAGRRDARGRLVVAEGCRDVAGVEVRVVLRADVDAAAAD